MLFIQHNSQDRQIAVYDQHAYTKDNLKWYPSTTHVLGMIDRGENFYEWLKNNGHNADYQLIRAGETGSKTHEVTELYDSQPDRTINIREYDADGKVLFEYDLAVWKMLARYVEFQRRFKPEMLAIEQVICSDTLGVGGQLDRVFNLKGERWLCDIKTGNFLYDEHDLQLATYKYLWDEAFPEYPIEKMGVLHLNAQTRTEGKGDKIQGRGWQLIPVEQPYEELIEVFKGVFNTWKWKNKNWKPLFLELPDHFCKSELNNNPDETTI